jgi:molybdopterin-guanine dinucleotide biosynthesis protein A
MHHTDLTLAILAGGEGSRMGRAKSMLLVNDRPILEHLLDRLAWPGPTLLITAPGRERPAGAARFGRECIDPVAGQGPLRGVLTALENAATPLVAVTAVDMPTVQVLHLQHLVKEAHSRPAALALMPARDVEGRRQVEPFPSIFHVDAAETIRARLARDERSVARLIDEGRFVTVDVNWEPSAWLNLNHPTDLPALARRGLRIR